jgi:RecA/RadA recombinase
MLLARLRGNDKKGLFEKAKGKVSYPTGFGALDCLNGEFIEVRDSNNVIKEIYPSLGFVGGTFITILGNTGVAKSTFCIQSSYEMIKNFDSGMVIYYDLERALGYTRILNLTGATTDEIENKFILRQDKNNIEDILEAISQIANEKESNKKEYMYNTGKKDEFDNPIFHYVPTVVVIDSIAALVSKDSSLDEIDGQTEAMRMAKKIKQFYQKLTPVINTYNITVICINHIMTNVDMNPFAKKASSVMYLKQDESTPGGKSPNYYAFTLLKLVQCGKKNKEDDGYDGFLVRFELIKSRTNKSGKSIVLAYNQNSGFDNTLSLLEFADDKGLLDGRNPKKYFKGYPDSKFDARKFKEYYDKDEILRKVMKEVLEVHLYDILSRKVVNGSTDEQPEEEYNIIDDLEYTEDSGIEI